jgi:hypothetical protein
MNWQDFVASSRVGSLATDFRIGQAGPLETLPRVKQRRDEFGSSIESDVFAMVGVTD